MAIDAAEADVDVGGGMTYLTGAKLAFTDPKVRTYSRRWAVPALTGKPDIPSCTDVPLHCRGDGIPKLLPVTH
jgi:hypothetical protein